MVIRIILFAMVIYEVPLVLLEHVGGVGHHDHPQSHKTLLGFQGVYDNGDGGDGDDGIGDGDGDGDDNVGDIFR